MPRYKDPEYLAEFLKQHTVPELKKLAGFISSAVPTCTAEIVGQIKTHLSNPEILRRLWSQPDEMQQADLPKLGYGVSE